MKVKPPSKHAIVIVGEDVPDEDVYSMQCAERNYKRLESLFGIIDSQLESSDSEEGSWFLQNIVFNILVRMNLSIGGKEQFLKAMDNTYDQVELHKERLRKHE